MAASICRAALGPAPSGGVPPGTEAAVRGLAGGGQPLPQSVRDFFEPRFGADFSQVRIHINGQASATARALQAQAFTFGPNLGFAPGYFKPESWEGRKLLAHELVHVIQQQGGKGLIQRAASADSRQIIIKTALGFENEHHLMGASGQIPDQGGGINPRKVLLNQKDHAASIDVVYGKKGTTTFVCGGRFKKVRSLPSGDPENAEHHKTPHKFKWTRICYGEPVDGEACDGKRHFDCGGFVSYCYHQAFPEINYPGKVENLKTAKYGWVKVDKKEIRPGDVAFRPGHAGLCIDQDQVISALNKEQGVHKEPTGRYHEFGYLGCLEEKKTESGLINRSETESRQRQTSSSPTIPPDWTNPAMLALKTADSKTDSCSAADLSHCSDEDLLTAVCIGEAGSIKDRDGKQGVINVVLNRLGDPAFPSTIREVVTQKSQFAGLEKGLKRLRDPAYAQCRELAGNVRKNPKDDPTLGAIFFDQSCSRPCSQYCTTYLGDGSTRAHYFGRRATKEEQEACLKTPKKREDHCCKAPRQKFTG